MELFSPWCISIIEERSLSIKRIGLLGGTFNPIHRGHIQIAKTVLKRLKLDRVLFIPTGTPPHKPKTALASRADRFRMVSLALCGHPHFAPCDIEIKRKGVSYTIDTLRALKRLYPQAVFYFIMGTDAFSHLSEWKTPKQVLGLCHCVVVPRRGHPFFQSLPKLPLRINPTAIKQLDDKKRKQYAFSTPRGTRIYFLQMTTPSITASEIRTGLTKKNQRSLLPQSVLSYIMGRRVYRKKRDSKKDRQKSSSGA